MPTSRDPRPIDQPTLRNRVQPGEHRRRTRLELLESRGRLDEHHLSQFFGFVIVMCSAPEIAVDAVVVTAERLLANVAHHLLLVRACRK